MDRDRVLCDMSRFALRQVGPYAGPVLCPQLAAPTRFAPAPSTARKTWFSWNCSTLDQ